MIGRQEAISGRIKFWTDIGSIMNAYQGFAKQNYTMLDNLKLGYGGTREEMLRLINDSGVLNKEVESLDEVSFDQIIQAINAIQTNLGITGTTAEEAEKTIQGSASMMEAAWQNLLTGMADDNANFEKLVDDFIDSVMTYGENILPRIKTTIEGMGKAIKELSDKLLPDVIATLTEEMPGFLDAIGSLFSGIGQGILKALPEVSKALMDILTTALEQLVTALPEVVDVVFQIVDTVIETLGEALPKILQAVGDVLPKIVIKIAENLPKFVESVGKVLLGVVEVLPEVVDAIISQLPAMMNAIGDAIMQSYDVLIKVNTELIKLLADALPDIIGIIIQVLPDLFNSLRDAFSDNMPELIDSIVELITTEIQALPQILEVVSAESIEKIILTIAKLITDNISFVSEASLMLFSAILDALPTIWDAIMKVLPELLKTFMTGLQLLSPKLKAYGAELLKKILAYFANLIIQARLKALEFVSAIISNIMDLPTKVFTILLGVLSKVAEFASSLIEKGRAAASDFVSNIMEKIKGLPGKIGSVLSQAIAKAGEFVSSMASKGKEAASSFLENVSEKLSGVSEKFKSVGTNIVKGIWEGMSSSYEWIKGKINGWVDNVLDYLKKVFKIGSPSKLMKEEIGQWLPLGMAEGFDLTMPTAEKQMQNTINNALNGLKSDVTVTAGNMVNVAGANGNGGYASGTKNQIINFNQTINSPKALDRLAIYQDTNNQLFAAKVRLSNV